MMPLDDAIPWADIIRSARQGERAAMEAIVRRYQGPVRACAAAHCPPGGDVDEVVQRTSLPASTRIAEFKEGTSFRAWLFAITRFQLLTGITRLRRLAAAVLVCADSVRTFCLASFRKHSYYTRSGGPAGEPD